MEEECTRSRRKPPLPSVKVQLNLWPHAVLIIITERQFSPAIRFCSSDTTPFNVGTMVRNQQVNLQGS